MLENGPSSPWAGHFDVDWDPPEAKLRNTVLMPVLGDHYGRVLDAGRAHARARRRPASSSATSTTCSRWRPGRWTALLADAAARAGRRRPRLPGHAPPAPAARDAHRPGRRGRAPPRQGGAAPPARPAARRAARPRRPRVDAAVADAQRRRRRASTPCSSSRTTAWPTGARPSAELDYRRFFDINTLVGLRVEDPRCSTTPTSWSCAGCAEGVVDGLRVDHPDGLRDPERLPRPPGARPRPARGSWSRRSSSAGEELPAVWPVAGTTGYDFLNRDRRAVRRPRPARRPLTEAYGRAHRAPTPTWRRRGARRPSELVVRRAAGRRRDPADGPARRRVRAPPPPPRPHPPRAARGRCASCSSRFPVYRTYVRADGGRGAPRGRGRRWRRRSAASPSDAARPRPRPARRSSADLLLLRLDGRTAARGRAASCASSSSPAR